MDKKDKAKETIQPEISVEQLQTENGELRDRVSDLETRERVMSEDFDKAKTLYEENEALKKQVADLEIQVKESIAEANKWENEYNEAFRKLTDEITGLETKIEELSAEENDTSTLRKVDKEGNVKIKFLLSPAGKFLLPYNVGQVVSHPENQADEMVELKYAEYAK